MKRYFKLLLALLIMFSIVSFNDVKALSYGNYIYKILDNGTIEIVGYTGKEENITIPSVINGRAVTQIGEEAFMGCDFKTVKISSGVTQIGSGAFTASSITTITIPNGVKRIADHTFFDCVYLTSISIPNSVTSIGECAFAGCENLLNIIIPKNVVNIGKGAFEQNWITPNKITINVYEGSYAEEYAKKNITDHESSFLYKIIDEHIQTVKLNKKTLTLNKGNTSMLKATINPTETTDSKTLTWTSSNTKVATVNNQGKITAKANGTATITVKTVNGKTATCKVTVKTPVSKLTYSKVTNKTYTRKQIKPNITVKDGKKTLKKGTDYTVSYGKNKSTGKATVKITGKGNYTGSITKTFYIVPKAPTGLKLTTGKKNIKVSYKKSTGASGYQIAYSTSKSKGFKYITVNSKTASKVIKKLKSKKKYYVKVRAYKTVGKKKYYGAYSNIKNVKVK